MACKQTCNGESKKVEIPKAAATSCTDQEGENNLVKLSQCKKCCFSFDLKQFGAQTIESCNKDCYMKYDKPADKNQGKDGS